MKRIIVLIVCVFMIVAMVASCSSQGDKVAEIKEAGELVMLTNAEFPPYEYLGDDNEAAGVDIDICDAIAEKLGVKLKVVNMDFDGLIPALVAGKGDIVAAGLTVTDERKEAVDFSNYYATAMQYIIAREDDDSVTCIDDLSEKVVGVQLGTTGDIIMSEDGMAKEIKQYKNALEASLDLSNGNIDAVVIDKLPAENIVNSSNGLKLIKDAFDEENYAIAVAKGNEDLVEVINSVVDDLYKSGAVDEWAVKHSELFAQSAK